MTGTLRHELAGLGLVLAAVGTILAVAEVARRLGWKAEHTRKVAHVGSGLVATAFPWLFSSALAVSVVCGAFAAAMAATARRGLLPAVHAVARRTWAAFSSCSVAIAFFASARPAPFVAAILTLASATRPTWSGVATAPHVPLRRSLGPSKAPPPSSSPRW
jgi:hypothetical protein